MSVANPTCGLVSFPDGVRITPSLHKLLTNKAETEGISLNQYMATVLVMSVGVSGTPRKRRKLALKWDEALNKGNNAK